jgi:hypothetical protein
MANTPIARKTLRPERVNFLHADLRGDAFPTAGAGVVRHADGPPADEDSDGDGQDNYSEEMAGTHPLAADSRFELTAGAAALNWPFRAERFYDVWYTPDLLQPFLPLATGLATNAYAPESNGFYRLRVRK